MGDALVMMCTGCGSTESIAEIRRKHPRAISCCPERKMVERGPKRIDKPRVRRSSHKQENTNA